MEVKSTEELRALIKQEIYDQRLSIASVARQAETAQPGFNNFVNGDSGMNANTMFSVLSVLGIVFDAKLINDGKGIESAVMELHKQPVAVKPKPDFKDKLVQAFRNEIEGYTSNPDPNKPKFTVELILRLLESAIDKTATI